MKKLIFSAVALFSVLSASAENALTIAPLKVNAGDTNVEASVVLLNKDIEVVDMSFCCYLPDGFKFVGGGRKGDTYENGVTTSFTDRAKYSFDKTGGVWAGSINTNDKGYYLKCGGASKTADDYLEGEDGELMKIKFNVDSSVEPGVYPIIFKEVYFNSKGNGEVQNQTYVSYVVVGNPSDKALALTGIVPSFVNDALATETAISTLDLSGATAVNGTFTYVDGRAVVGTEATASVKYAGDKAGYYSVNVPFDGNFTGKLYEYTKTEGGFAIFDEATSVAKGKTYLADGPVTLSAASAAVATVETKTGAEGSYVKDGKFYHGTGLTVPATRGLFDVPAGSNLRVVVDGVLTDITTAQIEAGEVSYDLQGRQVQNAKNGVFVVNGKKQFVK